MAEHIKAGTMFDVLLDGAWAGYVAGKTGGQTLGLPGYTVHELLLAPSARGRGYGAYLSVLLARALPDADGVLIGTIHSDNRGAQQAARAAGRVDVGGWFQLPL